MSNPYEIIDQVHELHFDGNIVPHTWYEHLTRPNGKPYLEAIVLLSDIVYWYRPRVIRDENTNRVIRLEKRFAADKLQRSYGQFTDMFGMGKSQVRNALKYLEAKGIITLEFKTINVRGTQMSNVLFIEPVVEALRRLNTPYQQTREDLSSDETIAPVTVDDTYTETSTETSSETTSVREEAPDGAAPDVDTSWPVGDPAEPESTPTTPPQESILKQKDPILMAAEVARRTGGKASWTVAGPEGADPYLDGPLDATLRILRREREGLDPEARAKLARQLRRIVEGPAYEKETDPPANGTPALFLQACRLWPDEFAWKAKSRIAYSNIYKGAFVDDMRSLMCQIQDGTIGASSKLVITNA